MATEDEAISGLEDFRNNLADNLGKTDPSANRVTSRTKSDGSSETFSSIGDQLHAMRLSMELADQMEMKKNAGGAIRFVKLTRN